MGLVGPDGLEVRAVRVAVADLDDDTVGTLAVDAQGKTGAKKRPPTPREVPWAELGSGRVQVEFGRPGADGPSDDTPSDDAPSDDAPSDDDLSDDDLTDDDLTDDTDFADDDIEPGGIPQARGGAQ